MSIKKTKRVQAGLVKVSLNKKAYWLSKEDRNGWSLGFSLGKKTVWLTGLRFRSEEHIESVLNLGVIYVEKKKK